MPLITPAPRGTETPVRVLLGGGSRVHEHELPAGRVSEQPSWVRAGSSRPARVAWLESHRLGSHRLESHRLARGTSAFSRLEYSGSTLAPRRARRSGRRTSVPAQVVSRSGNCVWRAPRRARSRARAARTQARRTVQRLCFRWRGVPILLERRCSELVQCALNDVEKRATTRLLEQRNRIESKLARGDHFAVALPGYSTFSGVEVRSIAGASFSILRASVRQCRISLVAVRLCFGIRLSELPCRKGAMNFENPPCVETRSSTGDVVSRMRYALASFSHAICK